MEYVVQTCKSSVMCTSLTAADWLVLYCGCGCRVAECLPIAGQVWLIWLIAVTYFWKILKMCPNLQAHSAVPSAALRAWAHSELVDLLFLKNRGNLSKSTSSQWACRSAILEKSWKCVQLYKLSELVDLLFLKNHEIVSKSLNIYFSNTFNLGDGSLTWKSLRTTGFRRHL